MSSPISPGVLILALLFTFYYFASGELLIYSTPLANLALGRQFEASSTCGQIEPAQYCYSESNGVLFTTDSCYTCDASSPQLSKGVENLNDDDLEDQLPQSGDGLNSTDEILTERTWWQSADLNRETETVTIELKFEREFEIFQVAVDFRSLRPASASLEVSTDFGNSYKLIQYYSDKCLEDFGVGDSGGFAVNGEAGCTSNYTDPSPGPLIYEAQDSSLAAVTNVRLSLLRLNTPPEDIALGEMLQHYAIYNFEVLGTCTTDTCNQTGLICVCEEVPTITTTSSPPQSCDLPGVSGPACDICLSGYFNYSESSGCLPCTDCNPDGTLDTICSNITGQCDCAKGVLGPTCSSCPEGSIGPSGLTETRCTSCFCNGFSTKCESAGGWYQAEVSNSFGQDGGEGEGFKSDGVIKNESSGFLEVKPSSASSNSIILSFPKDYLGDKRTSYNQRFFLNLSLPYLDKSQSPSTALSVCLEVVGRTVRYPQVRIIWSISVESLGTKPQFIEVPLVSGKADLVPYFSISRGRLAKSKDIREVLADIRMMRLIISTKSKQPEADPSPLTIRLHSSSLSFAVDNPNSPFTLQPAQTVTYVERCTQCPSTRMGENCDQCSEGHTIDPSNGGEFSRCVECFCNFHSDACHPVSGECFNCTGNTFGVDCEQCQPGYARRMPLTLLPCDQCADGFWDPNQNGTCIPCSCNFAGSVNNICDKSSGICECRENIVGDHCDLCAANTSLIFPSCEPCDECTEQWLRRIVPLEEQVQDTIEFVSSLNLTNVTQDIPLLDELLVLASEIEALLSNSSFDELAMDVENFNSRLCRLANLTDDLITRGAAIEAELDRSTAGGEEIKTMKLPILMNSLRQLKSDFENFSMIFESQDFISVNPTFYIDLARLAQKRADSANQLVRENVTTLLNETILLLETFNTTLDENDVIGTNDQLQEAVANISSMVGEMQAFITIASQRLCGTGNDTCLECMNESCEVCPSGIRCDGLIVTADLASNISSSTLVVAEDLLEQITSELQTLEELLAQAHSVGMGVDEVADFVNEIRNGSLQLIENVQSLTSELERELNATRVDPNDIGRIENATLSLRLNLLPNEFFDLLVEINTTIEAYFNESGVNVIGLRERVDAALERARRANDLAIEVSTNATTLRQLITELLAEQDQLGASINQTNSVVRDAESALQQVEALLGNTETSLNNSWVILAGLGERLATLEQQIDQNRVDLVEAKNLSSIAREVANDVENDSISVEQDHADLRDEVMVKLDQSEQDLEAALDIRNRTMTLLQLTQQQLLDIENFERTKNALITEQLLIRGDVLRVANELEALEVEIETHIARNTGCLDGPVLSKKKRRKRSSRLRKHAV